MTALAPDPKTAVHMHRLSVALSAVREAETLARDAGLDPLDLIRALDFLKTTPERVLENEERLARILLAVQAPGVTVEQCDVVERIHDESPRARKVRIRQEGYVAGILGETDPPGWLKTDADREHYAAGLAAFHSDLSKF